MIHEKICGELRDSGTKGCIGRFPSLRYNSVKDDPIEEKDACFTNLGLDAPEEIAATFQKVLSDAISNCFTADGSSKLRKFLVEFKDIFRDRLGHDDRPAKCRTTD